MPRRQQLPYKQQLVKSKAKQPGGQFPFPKVATTLSGTATLDAVRQIDKPTINYLGHLGIKFLVTLLSASVNPYGGLDHHLARQRMFEDKDFFPEALSLGPRDITTARPQTVQGAAEVALINGPGTLFEWVRNFDGLLVSMKSISSEDDDMDSTPPDDSEAQERGEDEGEGDDGRGVGGNANVDDPSNFDDSNPFAAPSEHGGTQPMDASDLVHDEDCEEQDDAPMDLDAREADAEARPASFGAAHPLEFMESPAVSSSLASTANVNGIELTTELASAVLGDDEHNDAVSAADEDTSGGESLAEPSVQECIIAHVTTAGDDFEDDWLVVESVKEDSVEQLGQIGAQQASDVERVDRHTVEEASSLLPALAQRTASSADLSTSSPMATYTDAVRDGPLPPYRSAVAAPAAPMAGDRAAILGAHDDEDRPVSATTSGNMPTPLTPDRRYPSGSSQKEKSALNNFLSSSPPTHTKAAASVTSASAIDLILSGKDASYLALGRDKSELDLHAILSELGDDPPPPSPRREEYGNAGPASVSSSRPAPSGSSHDASRNDAPGDADDVPLRNERVSSRRRRRPARPPALLPAWSPPKKVRQAVEERRTGHGPEDSPPRPIVPRSSPEGPTQLREPLELAVCMACMYGVCDTRQCKLHACRRHAERQMKEWGMLPRSPAPAPAVVLRSPFDNSAFTAHPALALYYTPLYASLPRTTRYPLYSKPLSF